MATRIYTKTGDDGTTGLFGGERVRKDTLRIEAYGTVDELNSLIGAVRGEPQVPADVDEILGTIQEQLFVLGADLATPERKEGQNFSIPRVMSDDLVCLESAIDKFEESLPPLKHFILPGGTPAGALLHVARTVARRGERLVVALFYQEPEIGELPMQYLNRLSDLLFVLARSANNQAGVREAEWLPESRK